MFMMNITIVLAQKLVLLITSPYQYKLHFLLNEATTVGHQ